MSILHHDIFFLWLCFSFILISFSGLMVVLAENPVHSILFFILAFCDTSSLLILLGLDFFAMIFQVVHIGAIAVSFLFVVSNRILTLCWTSMYIYFHFYLPRRIIQILFVLFLSLLTIRLGFVLFHFTSFFFVAEALVFASSDNGASAQDSTNLMLLGNDDLSHAVALYLPQGG